MSECKGIIYRGRVNAYINDKGKYVYQESMTPLKRLSCNGCDKCGWIHEAISEGIGNERLPIIDNIQDNALYEVAVENESRDWETGYIDDYDLVLVPFVEDN